MATKKKTTKKKRTWWEVTNFKTKEVATKFDITDKSERQRDKLERGLMLKMDLDNWYIAEVER